MVAGVEEVVTTVTRCHHNEVIYLQLPQTTLKHDFERRLSSIYKHIIRYQVSATSYYRRNTMCKPDCVMSIVRRKRSRWSNL